MKTISRLYSWSLHAYERGWAIGIVLLSSILPLVIVESGPSPCLFRGITGMKCPGCGMTRAFVSFFHGGFVDAVVHNHLVVVVLPVICAVAGVQTVRTVKACRG